MKKTTWIFMILMLFVTETVLAKGVSDNSINPLNFSVRMVIPNSSVRVSDAVIYVLEPTGYKLIIGEPITPSAYDIALRPIPPEAFSGKVMSVADALLMLIGNDSRLIIDPKHHLVSFEKINA